MIQTGLITRVVVLDPHPEWWGFLMSECLLLEEVDHDSL